MKRMILGYVLILGDLLFRMLPVLVTIVIAGVNAGVGGKKDRRRAYMFSVMAAGGIHFLPYLLAHRLLLRSWNLFETVRKIVKVEFSYQDADYFTCSFLACMVAAVLLGMIWRAVSAVFRGDHRYPVLSGTKRNLFLFLSAAAAGVLATGCYAVSSSGVEHIVINEVCGNNLSFPLGEAGEASDYVELYNKGRLSCKVEGLYLSDSEVMSDKKEVPVCEIPPRGYLLVPLDGGSFSLKKEGGETVYLSDASGKALDSVTAEAAEADFSYARQADGDPVWVLQSCTPGTANAAGIRWVEKPVLSRESGFYKDAFDLELYARPGAEIYYTLDGSLPTAKALPYQGPIHIYDKSFEPNVYRAVQNVVPDWLTYIPDQTPVEKGFVVRAVAVTKEAGNITGISSPVTATYFIDLEQYRQRAVVCLTADPRDLFGPDGIYVTGDTYDTLYLGGEDVEKLVPNFFGRGKAWEIPANLELFSDTLNFSQNVGLRVSGGYVRYLPLKNFSIYARKEYGGSAVFDERIFGDVDSHKLFIRGSLANAVCQALAEGRNVAVQRYVPVSVFLNGEFWYHSNILEKYDDDYFMQRYGIDRNNLIVLKSEEFREGSEEDRPCFQEIYEFLDTHDMTEPSSYEAFGRLVDLQSYIDYMCINIYMDNMDFSEKKNAVMWRSRTVTSNPYEDGRWRWALYDMDAMEWNDAELWGYGSQAEKDTFSLTPRFTEEIKIVDLPVFKGLRDNPDFRRQFVLTFMDLVNENFRYERAKEKLDAYNYDPVGYQGGNDGETQPRAYYDDFFRDRASYIVPCMADWFRLSGTPETVTLSVNDAGAGTVTLNTITPDLSDGSWSGTYYTDYPVTVTAVPHEGYEFVRWEKTTVPGGAAVSYDGESRMEIPVEKGGISLHGVFQKSG